MKMILLVILAMLHFSKACIDLQVTSSHMGAIEFKQIPIEDDTTNDRTGRASYVSTNTEKNVYLYHIYTSGLGRWVINEELGSKEFAMGYINSWAIAPYLVYPISDNFWKFPKEDDAGAQVWNDDPDFEIQCINYSSGDSSFYFESSPSLSKDLAGFFVLRTSNNNTNQESDIYSFIKPNSADLDLYMYKFEKKWMISSTIGVDSSFAFVDDDAATPHGIEKEEWHFLGDSDAEAVWQFDYAYIYSHENVQDDSRVVNAYDALFYYRAIKYIPKGQRYLTLRNSLPMPTLGLGTGGIAPDNMKSVIKDAISLGYRSFDLAREYGNEWVIPEVLADIASDETAPLRREIFIETKVWPTDLGFYPTYDAILDSLKALKTNYIDMYLIHWPKCDPNIDWMHCADTKDPDGTWQESWQAMEKFYAEGRIMSIGVSNFNVDLLKELLSIAVVKPHLIQNWSEPGRHDDAVRDFASQHDIIYQPYASLRNINAIPPTVTEKLQAIADERQLTIYQVALRFFVQTGCAVIPRSSQSQHLKENLEVFKWSLSREEMDALGWAGKEIISENEEL